MRSSSKPPSNNVEKNAEDLRLSPRVFSQNLMEETGVVEAVVGVLYDLFPSNDDDDDMRDAEAVRSSESVLNSERSSASSHGAAFTGSTGAVAQRSEVIGESDRVTTPATPSTPSTPISSARDGASLRPPSAAAAAANDSVEAQSVLSAKTTGPTTEQRAAAILFPTMEIVFELSSHQRCAEVLVLSGALHYVVFIMDNINDPQDELLPLCIVALWNVLELCHEKMKTITKCASRRELLVHFRLRNAAHFLGNEFTFQTLLHVFELLLARGYRKQDKELRNECVMVMHLLARRRRSLDFFYSTGLTATLLSYATAAETPKKKKLQKKTSTNGKATARDAATTGANTAVLSSARAVAINADHHNFATNCDEDFEFKQMLWYLIAELMCDHEANLHEFVQFRFAETLLSYATAGWSDQDSSAQHHHSTAQRQFLQSTALSVLNHIAPYILDHLYELGGHRILLEFLQSSVMQSDEVLGAAWLLMTQVAPAIHTFQDELGRIGAVEVAVAVFAAPPSRHTFGIRRNAILASASMCRDHEANRHRFNRAHGVHPVNQHLEFDPSHSVLEENILVAIVDAVRSCIVGDPDSENAFIEEDGVPKLLAVLERVPQKAVKNQVLAALAEICVNPAAIPSFLAWRSDLKETNNFTATQLLLRIYTGEDAAEELRLKAASDDVEIVALSNARHSAFKSVAMCRNPFIVSSKRVDDDFSGDVSEVDASRAERPQSPAFARLMEALKAAQASGSTQRSGAGAGQRSLLELRDAESHPDVNLKAKIYAVLANVSFACDAAMDKLTPRDQLMLEVAKEYPTFQIGEMWQNVHLALHAEGVRPIYADALYIRRHIEHAYNVSVCTKLAQQEILTATSERDAADEQAFLQQILLQKDQEAQAEAFHRANLRHNSTLKLHFDAKRTRLEFLRKQDPTAYAAYESSSSGGAQIHDPAPACDCSDLNSLEQKEAELRGRPGTLSQRK